MSRGPRVLPPSLTHAFAEKMRKLWALDPTITVREMARRTGAPPTLASRVGKQVRPPPARSKFEASL